MPAKFQLSSSRAQNILHLKLLGEFDGSAACELIRKIEEDVSWATKILVDTTELRHIHPRKDRIAEQARAFVTEIVWPDLCRKIQTSI